MSMRKAINDKCKSCIYDPLGGAGTWRQQVEACTIVECGLYPYRPKALKKKVQDQANLIGNMEEKANY
jgi:hypothetical protein